MELSCPSGAAGRSADRATELDRTGNDRCTPPHDSADLGGTCSHPAGTDQCSGHDRLGHDDDPAAGIVDSGDDRAGHDHDRCGAGDGANCSAGLDSSSNDRCTVVDCSCGVGVWIVRGAGAGCGVIGVRGGCGVGDDSASVG